MFILVSSGLFAQECDFDTSRWGEGPFDDVYRHTLLTDFSLSLDDPDFLSSLDFRRGQHVQEEVWIDDPALGFESLMAGELWILSSRLGLIQLNFTVQSDPLCRPFLIIPGSEWPHWFFDESRAIVFVSAEGRHYAVGLIPPSQAIIVGNAQDAPSNPSSPTRLPSPGNTAQPQNFGGGARGCGVLQANSTSFSWWALSFVFLALFVSYRIRRRLE
jgi:hypothetical protein